MPRRRRLPACSTTRWSISRHCSSPPSSTDPCPRERRAGGRAPSGTRSSLPDSRWPRTGFDDVTSKVIVSQSMAVASVELRPGTAGRILDAAFDAVRDFGLSRATMEDVAQRAGLSRQTLYRYFPSKDAFIVALISREEERFIAGVRSAIAGHDDLGPSLAEGVGFVLRFARQHPLLDRLLARSEEHTSELQSREKLV